MAEENKNLENEELDDENIEDQDDKSGEDGKDSNDDEGGKGKDTKDDKGDKSKSTGGKTFTQGQVTRMMTKEKNQGRLAALKELGIDPKDTKAVNMVKALIESQKTDEQKEAEKASAEAAKVQEAEERAFTAEAKAEAMIMGVKTQYVDDVVALAKAKMTEDSDLKTIVGEFKTKYPIWFGEDSEDEKDDKSKTGKKGTGSSIKTKSKDADDKKDKGLGARLAAQRKSGSKKSSYWGSK